MEEYEILVSDFDSMLEERRNIIVRYSIPTPAKPGRMRFKLASYWARFVFPDGKAELRARVQPPDANYRGG